MAISQFILDKSEQKRMQTRTRGLALVKIRYYYIGLLGLVAVATGVVGSATNTQIAIYAAVSGSGLITNTIIGIILRSASRKPVAYTISAYVAILLDVSLATAVVVIQGGYPSRATVLYAVPILTSGVLLFRPSAYIAAGIASICYTASLFIQFFRGENDIVRTDLYAPAIFYPVVFFIIAAIVTRFSAANAINKQDVMYNQLLGMVRQQLSQPTATIASKVEAIEQDQAFERLSTSQQQLIRHIKEENFQLSTTITELINNAGVEAIPNKPKSQHETIDLSAIVTEAARRVAMNGGRIASLHLNVQENIKINSDGKQIHSALTNILDNAFRYSEPTKPVEVSLESKAKQAVITITDQGRGMTPQQQKAIFERFDQFENNTQTNPNNSQSHSAGLGLHVSKLIIERFGGTFNIFSQPRVGTKITITLPKK